MWDFVMDKSGVWAGFLRELRFPLPIYIPSASPQSSSLSHEAGTKARSGRSANSLTNQIKKKTIYENIGKLIPFTKFRFKMCGKKHDSSKISAETQIHFCGNVCLELK
jgi:hypothetical protein